MGGIAALMKSAVLTRDVSAHLTGRYSEHKETAEQLSGRVNPAAI